MQSQDLTPLGRLIKGRLDELKWTQSRLAEESGAEPASISRLMRGLQAPTHPLVEKLADALRLDVLHMKELAGLRVVTPPAQRDPMVEYWAQRLDALPPEMRAAAIDAIGAQVNAFYRLREEIEVYEALLRDFPELEEWVRQRREREAGAGADSLPPDPA